MGRTSIFSFPLPGRKRNKEKDKDKEREKAAMEDESSSTKASGPSTRKFSKAHRILGTNDVNINSANADENFSRYPSSKSSRMSISISESTHSLNENGSVTGSQTDQSEESGVFGRRQWVQGKASSTLLGQSFSEDMATNTTSGAGRPLRREDSSSTLKSHYDRQKASLLVSQQTSASSARDMALRKGQPLVVQRSPLLQPDMALDPNDKYYGGYENPSKQSNGHAENPKEKGFRKKPAKLDLSSLFPKTQPNGSSKPPDARSTNSTPVSPGRRKLTKPRSKESLQSQKRGTHTSKSHDPQQYRATEKLDNLYDHYEQMAVRSPRMDRIPESGILDSSDLPTPRSYGHHLSPERSEQFSWKNVRASLAVQRGEASSAASISSQNTKTSRHTSKSALSNTDLKMKSVLSLSSDSEDDDWESRSQSSRRGPSSAHRKQQSPPPLPQPPAGLSSRWNESKKAGTGAGQGGSSFLSAPENSAVNDPTTPPWSTTKDGSHRPSSNHRNEHRSPSLKAKKPSRKMSITSARSSQQPTPPQSPASAEFRGVSEPNGLLMAVTKQEEALLEALRLKKTRMREKIIEEHEVTKSPPRTTESRPSSEASSGGRGRGRTSQRKKVPLYLDTPLAGSQHIDYSEPSPDLSDFLTFGSDEDSTPRTSWAPSRDQYRSDLSVPQRFRDTLAPPSTPPSAARLSAVGVGGFKLDRSSSESHNGAGKRRNIGVRFVEDQKLAPSRDFLLDENEQENENEGGIAWAM